MPVPCSYVLPVSPVYFFFFFNDTATTEIYTLSLHDALPILDVGAVGDAVVGDAPVELVERHPQLEPGEVRTEAQVVASAEGEVSVGVTREVDLGSAELVFVVVGGAEHEVDRVAGLELHTPQLDV